MDSKDITVYVASSVAVDYYSFLAKTIKGAGYKVNMLFLIDEFSYRSQARKRGIFKVFLRFQMYVMYPVYLIITGLLSPKGSIFVVSSNTFYAPYLVHSILKRRHIKVIHMLYDLYPDALEVARKIRIKSLFSHFLGYITRMSQKNCEATVYLGHFLKIHAESRWGKSKLSKVIDISTDLGLYSSKYRVHNIDTPLTIHYGGQMGHLHDSISIIESIKFIKNSDIAELVNFNFYVSGSQAALLRKELNNYSIMINPTKPSKQWRNDIGDFHIGLVSLSPGGASVCLPSKTYAMMAGGLAILAIAPGWSDLGTMIKKMDSGWVINNSAYQTVPSRDSSDYLMSIRSSRDTQQISKEFYGIIRNILSNRNILELKRVNAFFGMRKLYNQTNLQRAWQEVLESMSTNSHSLL